MSDALQHLWDAKRRRDLARLRLQVEELLAASEQVVLVDTETTDLEGEVLEINVRSLAGAIVLDTLVRPQCPISPAAVRCHGITAEMIAHANAPAWPEIHAQVAGALAGRLAVAYNAPFDQGAIQRTSRRHPYLVPVQARRWFDLLRAYATFRGEWDPHKKRYLWHRLAQAVQQCGLDLAALPYHRAAGDTEAARRLLLHMAAQLT